MVLGGLVLLLWGMGGGGGRERWGGAPKWQDGPALAEALGQGGPILSPHAPAGLRTQPQMFEASVRYGVTAQAEARGSAGARLFSV